MTDKEKKFELIAKVVSEYFEQETENTTDDAIDVIFTIDEIIEDQSILTNAHLYDIKVITENPMGFDVVG